MKRTFENTGISDNKSDWMAEELRYEARINTWQAFDNASRLEREHKENCAAKQVEINSVKSTPNLYLSKNDNRARYVNDTSQYSKTSKTRTTRNNGLVAIIAVIFYVMLILSMIVSIFN